ncbi:MAG: hypothetical protein KDA22_15120 [Phycisphaerales bacterium]|nr:hypothetical protein [Phycisphaerales bacterium]
MTNLPRTPAAPRLDKARRRTATTGGVRTGADRIMLLVASVALLLLAACAPAPASSSSTGDRVPAPDHPAPTTLPAAAGADDGARIVGDRILAAIDAAGDRPSSGAVLSLGGLSNASDASAAEFDAFRARLAALLDAALAPAGLAVVPGHRSGAAYEMIGSASLDMFRGFNTWVLQLSLVGSAERRTIWTADGQVRVLRSPPTTGVQVFPPRQWLDARAVPALWRSTDGGSR